MEQDDDGDGREGGKAGVDFYAVAYTCPFRGGDGAWRARDLLDS